MLTKIDKMEARQAAVEMYLQSPDLSTRAVASMTKATLELVEKRRMREAKPPGQVNGAKMSEAAKIGRGKELGVVIKAGRYVDVWIPIDPVDTGRETPRDKGGKRQEEDWQMARRVNSRARKQIRRWVNANNLQGMITLTLALPSETNDKLYKTVSAKHQRDYAYVRKLFKLFCDRLRRAGKTEYLRYVAVFEQHDSQKTSEAKRYTWHIHLATDVMTEHDVSEIGKAWKHGRIDYQDYRYDTNGKHRDIDIQNPGAYIAEYIGKDGAQFGQKQLRNKRRYTRSRNLSRPLKSYISEHDMQCDGVSMTMDGKEYKATWYGESKLPDGTIVAINAQYMEV